LHSTKRKPNKPHRLATPALVLSASSSKGRENALEKFPPIFPLIEKNEAADPINPIAAILVSNREHQSLSWVAWYLEKWKLNKNVPTTERTIAYVTTRMAGFRITQISITSPVRDGPPLGQGKKPSS
tara:strand:- start:3555 stop:3935 length:381 start_codon:yes stop_codon:yes gene_type:complete